VMWFVPTTATSSDPSLAEVLEDDDEPPQAAARAASAARQVIQRVRPITNYAAISRRMSSIASSNSSPWWTPGRVAGGSTAGRRLSSRVATV
jgi:hypothetical protein